MNRDQIFCLQNVTSRDPLGHYVGHVTAHALSRY